MKKILLVLGLCCSVNLLFAQDVQPGFQDSHHNLIGTMENGMLLDQHHNFLGQFKSDANHWTLLDSHHKPVGYIVGTEVQDANYQTVGYFVGGPDNSTVVQNAQHATIGRVKLDGTVESTTKGILGYAVSTEPNWAAAYFLMFKF